jgi:putative acetyltransferase
MDGGNFHILAGDLDDPRVVELLTLHASRARTQTGRDSAHALDPDQLRTPDISLWTIWDGDDLAGVGALRQLDADHGEIKSMHVAADKRGNGFGAAILRHIIAAARERGYSRLSLETGAWDYFVPARTLYARQGFHECAPFAEYRPDPNSIFMTIEL